MKKKIFITGGTGFIGGHLLKQAVKDWDVFACYRTNKFAFPDIEWIQFDLTDFPKLMHTLQNIKPDVVLHAAATANLDEAEENQKYTWVNNVSVTQQLAQICQQKKIRLIFVSTDMVFDGEHGLYTENDEPNPVNYYGETKLAAERIIRNTCANYAIARSSLVYGTSFTESQSFSERMIAMWQARKPVCLFTDQYRTPILVDNLGEALLELAQIDYVGTLHLGGTERVSRFDFGLVFAKVLSIPSHLIIPKLMKDIEFKAVRPFDTSFDVTSANHILSTQLLDCTTGVRFLMNYLPNES